MTQERLEDIRKKLEADHNFILGFRFEKEAKELLAYVDELIKNQEKDEP